MFTPWRITTRPSASVTQRPCWPSGVLGSADAAAAVHSSAMHAAAIAARTIQTPRFRLPRSKRSRSLTQDDSRCASRMIGALLAGGAGKRLGKKGSKAEVELAGRPLAAYPADALAEVCDQVVIVCKKSSGVPKLKGVRRWNEPDEPQHPLTGIVYAIKRAKAPVLICAADMPFVTADACRTLIAAARGAASSPAAVAVAEGQLQPALGVFAPAALDALRAAPENAPLTDTVES